MACAASDPQIVHVKEALDRAVDNCVHYPHDFNFKAAMSKLDDERSGLDAFSEERGSNVSSSLLTMSPSQRFPRTSFIVVSASWLQAASGERAQPDAQTVNIQQGLIPSSSCFLQSYRRHAERTSAERPLRFLAREVPWEY